MNATIVFSEQKYTFPHTDDSWIPKKGENRGGLIYIYILAWCDFDLFVPDIPAPLGKF